MRVSFLLPDIPLFLCLFDQLFSKKDLFLKYAFELFVYNNREITHPVIIKPYKHYSDESQQKHKKPFYSYHSSPVGRVRFGVDFKLYNL